MNEETSHLIEIYSTLTDKDLERVVGEQAKACESAYKQLMTHRRYLAVAKSELRKRKAVL